jgi:GntR family transcriptional regulator
VGRAAACDVQQDRQEQSGKDHRADQDGRRRAADDWPDGLLERLVESLVHDPKIAINPAVWYQVTDVVTGSSPQPVPRYREVADALEELIASGEMAPGGRVPSERAIAERFGLSRMTARQAVELLVRRGVVYRRPGSGTYVASPRVDHTLQRLLGFTEQMQAQGIEPSGRLLSVELAEVGDPAVSDALELGAADRAWSVRRVRYGDGEPLLIESFHVPERVCPDLGEHDLALGSLYAVLRTTYGVEPTSAHETIEPTACDEDDALHLRARPGAPAILVTRVTRDGNGRPIEHARDVYRGDRARFVIDLSRV